MNRHLNAVLLFGHIPNLVLLVALITGVHVFRSGIELQNKTKKAAYETYQTNLKEIAILEEYLSQDQRREKMEFWNSHLDRDLLQTLSSNLAEIMAGYKESEIQNTAIGRPGGSSPIGAQTEGSYSRVNLAFEGHYSAIQKTIAELEFRMPMMSLESMNLRPAQQSGNSQTNPRLKIELNYLCWRRPEQT